MSFSKNLIAARTRMNYSSKELAQKLGIPPTTYSNYELGLREPKFDILIKIAQVLQVSTDYLLGVDTDARNKYFLNQGTMIMQELGFFEVLNPFDYYNYGEFNLCFAPCGNEKYLHLPESKEQTQFIAFRRQDFIRFMEEAYIRCPGQPYHITQREILSDYVSKFLACKGPYDEWLEDLKRIYERSKLEHPEILDLFLYDNSALADAYKKTVNEIKGFLSQADLDFIIKREADMSYLYHYDVLAFSEGFEDIIDPELLPFDSD